MSTGGKESDRTQETFKLHLGLWVLVKTLITYKRDSPEVQVFIHCCLHGNTGQ